LGCFLFHFLRCIDLSNELLDLSLHSLLRALKIHARRFVMCHPKEERNKASKKKIVKREM
jgi:hypothetical protein